MANAFDIFVSILGNLGTLLLPLIYIPFVYPISSIYSYFTIYNPNCFKSENTPEIHSRKVHRIQDQILKWNQNGRKKKMCSARNVKKTMALRNIDKSKFTQIHLDEMEDIIEIDMEKMIVSVEPGIKMGTLTHKLLPLGVIIPIIPEFEGLTVGGLINGAGLETSSHKYGLFASSCLEYEVVLADGTVANCSEKENSDIFYGMPMAYGTLGFMTSVTFPLIKTGKYVKLEYHAAKSLKQAEALMRRQDNFFIEGIAYSKDESVIMFGNFTDTPERGKINHINRWYKNWFYKHAETFLRKAHPTVEYVPTRDYYHRHDRSYFWTLSKFRVSHCRIFIFLVGWVLPINYSFLKMMAPMPPKFLLDIALKWGLLQDFVIPLDKLEESVLLSDEITGVYPIWFCPTRMFKRPGLVRCRGDTDEDYIDIGIYGSVPGEKRKHLDGNVKNAVKKFEQFTLQNTGLQGMYTDCYLSPEEFNQMFDRTLYEKLRTELNCRDAFPDVYEKISVTYKTN